ncbi:MAG: CapA family protein [Candidatus Delongbacteria bacterium]|nr:CapA family protein [Candidatus Delongbacteria bacterium]MBN2835583.1 CapA family protein [Candidatus Delongbacteria bacterium]
MKVLCVLLLFSFSFSFEIVEDFENNLLNFESVIGEDIEPDSIKIIHGLGDSFLKIMGNSWKSFDIDTLSIYDNSVISVNVYSETISNLQGIGFVSGVDTLLYTLYGLAEANPERFVPDYQGSKISDQWETFLLPIGNDWMIKYGTLNEISKVIVFNDEDNFDGEIWFNDILNITEDLFHHPAVEIEQNKSKIFYKADKKSVNVSFKANISDPDSEQFTYLWDFGDGDFSTLANPLHTYNVNAEYSYTVFLIVTDDTNLNGYASTQVEVDIGFGELPVTLNFTGDIMIGRGFDSPGGIVQTYGIDYLFDPTKNMLGDNADLTIVNLEVPLTNSTTHHPTKSIYFKGNPDNATGLKNAGIDIASMANNHVYDYMEDGISDTRNALDSNFVLYGGAGLNSDEAFNPVLVSEKGVGFGIVFSSDRTGQYNNYQPYLQAGTDKPGFYLTNDYNVKKQIDEIRDLSDFVIVSAHTGSEYSIAPGADYDKTEYYGFYDVDKPNEKVDDIPLRHSFIDNGADLVICHHPHIVQGFEFYNGKLIAHSLGNFIFDMTYPETCFSMILNLSADKNKLYNFYFEPVYLNNTITVPATGKLGEYIMRYIAAKSKDLGTTVLTSVIDNKAYILEDSVYQYYDIQEVIEHPLTNENDTLFTKAYKLAYPGELNCVSSNITNFSLRTGRELFWFGSFENEGSDYWQQNSNSSYNDEMFYSGLQSYCINSNQNNYSTTFSNSIKLYGEKNITLRGMVYSEYSTPSIIVEFYSSRYYGLLSSIEISSEIPNQEYWQLLEKKIEVPDGSNFFKIKLKSNSITDVNISYFDDISVIGWNEWKETNNYQMFIKTPYDHYFYEAKLFGNLEELVTINNYKVYENYNVGVEKEILPNSININAYPNPFNNHISLTFEGVGDKVNEIKIFNATGQLVKVLYNDYISKNSFKLTWDGINDRKQSVSTGVYFVVLKNNQNVVAKKIILLK